MNKKQSVRKESEETDILPAYAHDYGNYVARYGMGNYQIQLLVKLDGQLDYSRLSRAVSLSVDAEPVLGCRFIEADPPYWKRREDLDSIELCTLEEASCAEESVSRYLESPLDMEKDPMLKVRLIRSGQKDTLVIKLNHTCSDGAGAKHFLLLLADIYSRLENENAVYKPEASRRDRSDHEKIFKTLGIRHPIFDNSIVEAPRSVWPFPWKHGKQTGITPFVVRQLPLGELKALSAYAKENKGTINDLIITAMYRAMFSLTRLPSGIPMDLGLTVDLRRYLPDNKADGIRNLSGGVILRLARISGEPFEGTLSRVISIMNKKKAKNPGYQCATGAEKAEKLSFHQFLAFSKFMSRLSELTSRGCFYCSPGLSNMGLISGSLINFGPVTVKEAYYIPPVVKAPGLLLVVSSYNEIMTLACGYYEGSVNRRYLDKLLESICKELVGGCR